MGEYDYPRFMTTDSPRFDVRDAVKSTEELVCKWGGPKKYTKFTLTTEHGGEATAFTVGCPFRCFYCIWGPDRDFPEEHGEYYTPQQVFNFLNNISINSGADSLRITGGDGAVGKSHLLTLLDIVEKSNFPKIYIDTTGIPFALDPDYVRRLAAFTKPHFTVMINSAYPENFSKRTGCIEENFELGWKAIKTLLDHHISFHVAIMTDKRLMKWKERDDIIKRLMQLGGARFVSIMEEREIVLTKMSMARLKYVGMGDKIMKELNTGEQADIM